MKKVAGIVFAMIVMGSLLAGCYSRACEEPAPMSYKGEAR